jgi:hypothetical protein
MDIFQVHIKRHIVEQQNVIFVTVLNPSTQNTHEKIPGGFT